MQALGIFGRLEAVPEIRRTYDNLTRCLSTPGRERFVAACVKAGMSEDYAKQLVERFEQGKESQLEHEEKQQLEPEVVEKLARMHGELGHEKFVAKCLDDGMEKGLVEELATVFAENEKLSEELCRRFEELGEERFVADCIGRGISEDETKELVEMIKQEREQCANPEVLEELIDLYVNLGREKFIEKCVAEGTERSQVEKLVAGFEDTAKQGEEYCLRYIKLGKQRFVADCIKRGIPMEDVQQLVEAFEQVDALDERADDTPDK